MANEQGDFIWYDLMTTDADAAAAFYTEVLGWEIARADAEYRIWKATDEEADETHEVAGLMQLTEEMCAGGARPIWLGYICVDDVDTSIEAIVADGGKIMLPATDIPDVGRFAMVTDPQGIPFYVMRSAEGCAESLAFAHDKPRPGHCAWNELATSDPKAALAFYSKHFGWQKDGEMDMGPMGLYEFIRHNGVIGALMPCVSEEQPPMWTFYFRVVDIDSAAERVVASGGQVVQGPQEVPGGDWIINGIDPQGAPFSLVGQKS